MLFWSVWAGVVILMFSVAAILQQQLSSGRWYIRYSAAIVALIAITWLLGEYWSPLRVSNGLFLNIFVTVTSCVGAGTSIFSFVIRHYQQVLGWCLDHKKSFLSIPIIILLFGLIIWQGFNKVFGFVADGLDSVGLDIRRPTYRRTGAHFPGWGKNLCLRLMKVPFC
ncbi:MAG: hypothetical protein U5L96_22110 [Owenweeksia sp.]|nr:hypothetical protein [Owenweeksia sp.]